MGLDHGATDVINFKKNIQIDWVEGHVSKGISELGISSIHRQLLPAFISGSIVRKIPYAGEFVFTF